MLVCGSVRSIVHVTAAGVPSVLPAASVALTSKVCEPALRPMYDLGEVHDVNAPASSLHSNVEPASLEVKLKLGSASLSGSEGEAVIVVCGSVRSIVQVKEAGEASTLPAASVALTSKVWLPAAR